ncbi:MAG: hypothetical protein IPG51_04705 [Chloroflexi bacterium]|nr:hypothetical protein [Chloroflexota bacterium]
MRRQFGLPKTAQEYALRRLAEKYAILEAAQELHTAGHLSASRLEISPPNSRRH